ncbi:hypothetical protein OV320_8354 [Actinobacteria bacterium OV320]|nr:hypothetical protein OV320_8354 [Actinobacteria bacterium OV320]
MQATALTGPDTLAVHNGSAGSGITAELPPLVFTSAVSIRSHTPSFCQRRKPFATAVNHGGKSVQARPARS